MDVDGIVRQSPQRGSATAAKQARTPVTDEITTAEFVGSVATQPTWEISPFKDGDQQFGSAGIVNMAKAKYNSAEPEVIRASCVQLTIANRQKTLRYIRAGFQRLKSGGAGYPYLGVGTSNLAG